MTMDDLERLIGLFERHRLTELDFADGEARVRLLRHDGGATPGTRPGHSTGATPVESAPTLPVTDHVIASGMVGTFYRAPSPGQTPFVTEGVMVEEGQTLAILEAMKMLNPVEADRPGRILRILAEDGAAVAPGTPLFALAPLD